MDNASDIMREIREDQLTRGINYCVILGLFVLIASLMRTFHVGWNNIMYIHICSYLLLLGICIFKRFMSFVVRAIIVIIAAFILGITGLIAWGLAGFGLTALCISCVLASILFGTTAGILTTILSIVSIGIIGAGVVKNIITFNFNASIYLTSYTTWLAGISGTAIGAGIIVIILSTINNRLLGLVQTLNSKNHELLITNKKLKKALADRSRFKAGLEKAQKMELVGTLAGGVAHDLNNILSSTISYPELILRQIPNDSPLKESLNVIKKSGIRAAAIVSDLLTLARRGVKVSKVTNLNHIVRECISSPEIEKIKIYHPGVHIDIRLTENLWNIIGADFHLMKTLNNLISNAAEAMPDGGKITIRTNNIKISKKDHKGITPGNYAVLEVSDTGMGISEKDKGRVFEPFYTKKVMGKSGTGLGMTVVWNTVKDHNGHINIESIEGSGTTFLLYFPMTNMMLPQVKTPSPVEEYTGNGESILVVDDMEEQREINYKILSELGYSVSTASNGKEAVEYLKHNSPDLVMLDMVMAPGMDGLNTYIEMLKLRENQRAIIVSGYDETEQVRKAQELGAGAYIKKPFLIETLASAIRAELDKEMAESDNCH